MSVAPNAGLIDFGTFQSPIGGSDGLQGQVPAPLVAQAGYVLTTEGWAPAPAAVVTAEIIIAALGYTPADEAVLGDIQAALDAINGV